MRTIDVGPAFFHFIRLNRTGPLLHTAYTVEIDPPFRRSKSLLVRVPFTGLAVVLGWWHQMDWDEEEALIAALQGVTLDLYDADLDDDEVCQVIRENIAAQGLPPDEEWQVISALGVAE